MPHILAADIGGTNSRFAHFEVKDGKPVLVSTSWLKTKEAISFAVLMEALRAGGFSLRPEEADIAVIAVAGPVEEGIRSSPPLIDWDIDISGASEDFGLRRALLINDFIAQAYFCAHAGEEAEEVLPGRRDEGAPVAVIGAGTGLGKAILVPGGTDGPMPFPSEGGHANFPFTSKEEFEFQEFLLMERGDKYITCNTVVSGGGLSYIHRFLTGRHMEPQDVAAELSGHPETLRWASRFYGRVCRNFALDTLAGGGLYIAGGVAAKVPELVKGKAFKEEFRSSDTLSEVLSKIPVFLVTDEMSGLRGAAFLGLRMLRI